MSCPTAVNRSLYTSLLISIFISATNYHRYWSSSDDVGDFCQVAPPLVETLFRLDRHTDGRYEIAGTLLSFKVRLQTCQHDITALVIGVSWWLRNVLQSTLAANQWLVSSGFYTFPSAWLHYITNVAFLVGYRRVGCNLHLPQGGEWWWNNTCSTKAIILRKDTSRNHLGFICTQILFDLQPHGISLGITSRGI